MTTEQAILAGGKTTKKFEKKKREKK